MKGQKDKVDDNAELNSSVRNLTEEWGWKNSYTQMNDFARKYQTSKNISSITIKDYEEECKINPK